jgi:hypothetical protein
MKSGKKPIEKKTKKITKPISKKKKPMSNDEIKK